MREVQQIVDAVRFEHLLLFLNAETENRSQEISESHRIVRAQHHEPNFRRYLWQISERLLNQRLNIALSGLNFFFVAQFQLGKHPPTRAQVWLSLLPGHQLNAIDPLHDQVQRVFHPLHALDLNEGSYLVEIFGFGITFRDSFRPHTDARE